MDSRWEEVEINWSDHIGQSKVANDIEMAARIESLENQLMQGKISPDRYEAARAALEKLGEEQQRTRQLHNEGSSKSSEHDPKEAIRRLRAIKTETEAAESLLRFDKSIPVISYHLPSIGMPLTAEEGTNVPECRAGFALPRK